jgi:hypothetical protein
VFTHGCFLSVFVWFCCVVWAGWLVIPPPIFVPTPLLFPAWVCPADAFECAVLFAPVTFSTHGLQVFYVVVWWITCDYVVYCPVVAF